MVAITQLYGQGPVPITVFGDRVIRLLESYRTLEAGKVLGHVLAHEICHALEGVARHSDSGLMKARWNGSDMLTMRGGGLEFARADRYLLRRRFEPGEVEVP